MWLRGNFPGVPWPRPPSVSSPRTPCPPRVWVGGRGGGRTSPHAYSQPRTERAALTPAALHRQTAQTCRSLGLFFSPAASFEERSPSWLSVSFCTQTRCRKSPSMNTSKGLYPILKVCGLEYSEASRRTPFGRQSNLNEIVSSGDLTFDDQPNCRSM